MQEIFVKSPLGTDERMRDQPIEILTERQHIEELHAEVILIKARGIDVGVDAFTTST